jgi:hypothetical protein
MTDFRRMKW